jgi:hypothetical protein
MSLGLRVWPEGSRDEFVLELIRKADFKILCDITAPVFQTVINQLEV